MKRIFDKNRASYKRHFSDGEGCVFCGEDDVLVCHGLAGRHWRVLVNRYPYMDGNVMIVPVRHVETTGDINREEWQEFEDLLVKTQKVLSEIFKTNSFNIGLNVGPESGASIPHLHWQVIPRKRENFSVTSVLAELYPVKTSPEEVKRLIDNATALLET